MPVWDGFSPQTPYGPVPTYGPLQGGSLNMWSAVQTFLAFNVLDPHYMDLSQGYAYAFVVSNTTDNDLTSGTITLEGADADATDNCKPGPFLPLEPVAGCDHIVSGIVATPPVRIDLSDERPIRAHSLCQFAAPCPKHFFRVSLTGITATDVDVIGVITHLRRTDFSHVGPLGYIPQPLAQPFTFGAPLLGSPYTAPARQLGQAAGAEQPQAQPRAGQRRQ